jgi:hypothetical protein
MENIDPIWLARMSLSIVNMSLLAVLIFIYTKRYMDIRSKFNLGFYLVVVALFFRTLFSSPVLRFFLLHTEAHSIVDPYRLIADVFELVAVSIFLYITTR